MKLQVALAGAGEGKLNEMEEKRITHNLLFMKHFTPSHALVNSTIIQFPHGLQPTSFHLIPYNKTSVFRAPFNNINVYSYYDIVSTPSFLTNK